VDGGVGGERRREGGGRGGGVNRGGGFAGVWVVGPGEGSVRGPGLVGHVRRGDG